MTAISELQAQGFLLGVEQRRDRLGADTPRDVSAWGSAWNTERRCWQAGRPCRRQDSSQGAPHLFRDEQRAALARG